MGLLDFSRNPTPLPSFLPSFLFSTTTSSLSLLFCPKSLLLLLELTTNRVRKRGLERGGGGKEEGGSCPLWNLRHKGDRDETREGGGLRLPLPPPRPFLHQETLLHCIFLSAAAWRRHLNTQYDAFGKGRVGGWQRVRGIEGASAGGKTRKELHHHRGGASTSFHRWAIEGRRIGKNGRSRAETNFRAQWAQSPPRPHIPPRKKSTIDSHAKKKENKKSTWIYQLTYGDV